MESPGWNFLFGLVLLLCLPKLYLATLPTNPNHLADLGQMGTQQPMVEPGQPDAGLLEPDVHLKVMTTRSLADRITTPNVTAATTTNSTTRNVSPTSLPPSPTMPSVSSLTTRLATTNYSTNSSSSVTSSPRSSATDGTAGPPLSTSSPSSSSSSLMTTMPATNVSTSSNESSATPNPIQLQTTEQNTTFPTIVYSTYPSWTWWTTKYRPPPPSPTTMFRRTTTYFRRTTYNPTFQTTKALPTTVSHTQPLTTKKRTNDSVPAVTTTTVATTTTTPTQTTRRWSTLPATTTPWHWPFPTVSLSPPTTSRYRTTSRRVTTRRGNPTERPGTTHSRDNTAIYPRTTIAPPIANSSYRIPVYVQIRLGTSWTEYCPDNGEVQDALVDYAQGVLKLPKSYKISVPYLNIGYHCHEVTVVNRLRRSAQMAVIPLDFFVAINGSYYENSTRKLGTALVSDASPLQETISFPIVSAYLLIVDKLATPSPQNPGGGQGVVIGTTLTVCALVFGVVLSLIGMKVYKVRKSQAGTTDRYYFDGKQLQDALSESHQMGGVGVSPGGTRSGGGGLPAPSYREYFIASINKGMVIDDEEFGVEEEAEEALPSHTLTDRALAKFYSYKEAIMEEFENLPGQQNMTDMKKKLAVHVTSKLKHPGPQSPEKTRVPIPPVSPTSPSPPKIPTDFVLDANFIRGFDSKHCSYIAAKVSGADSSSAFWRMVWEQQSRTIVCLCSPYELGKVCPQYWPTKEGGPGTQLYDNILVTLKGGASGEHYFTSTLLIRNVEKTLCRPVTHYWFTNWTEGDVPSSPQALMSMLLQVHNTHQESYGPVIVHCSDGIGRTGLVVATDINMQRMEESHTLDIPRTVSSMRQDRGQAVQNSDQYTFIYKTLYEFSKFLSTAAVKETSDTESVVLDNADDSISDTANEDLSSQGTNSSRASSYLGDLSSSIKRKLALKFPSLGISPPADTIPTTTAGSRGSTGEFVVINSPNTTNLDMSVVSGISDSEKGDKSSLTSSLHSPYDQTSFSFQNDPFAHGYNDSIKLVPKGSRHFTIGQRPQRREPSIARARPMSVFTRGSMSMSGYGDWTPKFGLSGHSNLPTTLASPQADVGVPESHMADSRDRSESVQSDKFTESLCSTNPFKYDQSREDLHEDCNAGNGPAGLHTEQPSYPTDKNPFGSTPSIGQSEALFSNNHAISTSHPQSAFEHSSSSYHSVNSHLNPFPDQSVTTNEQYPKESNPFETASELGDASVQSSGSISSQNSAFVFVNQPDTEFFVRQGTYPKGMNPFDESGSLQRSPLVSNRGGGSPALRLMPVSLKEKKTTVKTAEDTSDSQNPFGDDWMDSAEESFT